MHSSGYEKNSISLIGAVSMGTGVMIGAGIFALTGQIAELAGPWFPLSFVAGAIVTGFSAYTYVKMSNAYPSAGGIAMILQKTYGPGTITAGAALLMTLSMVINESLVARTFGTYALRPFDVGEDSWLVSVLAVVLIVFAYVVNRAGNRSVGLFSLDEIVAAKDYALAEASEPALGSVGFYFTIALALVATASGLLASVFAVSRMLAMLTDMKVFPIVILANQARFTTVR